MNSQCPILLSGLKFTTIIYFWFWECGSLSSGMALPEFEENPVVFTKSLYLVRNWAPNSVSPEVGAAEIFIWHFQLLAISILAPHIHCWEVGRGTRIFELDFTFVSLLSRIPFPTICSHSVSNSNFWLLSLVRLSLLDYILTSYFAYLWKEIFPVVKNKGLWYQKVQES